MELMCLALHLDSHWALRLSDQLLVQQTAELKERPLELKYWALHLDLR